MGALINQFTYFIGSQIFWRQIRKQLNHFRKERLGLDSISWRGPINKMLTEENPNLCCFSTHLVKKPSNWHNNIFISGYWFLKMEKEFIPTTNLAEFLKNGEAPIFFDFGSFANDMMDKKIKIILNDIIKSGERLIIAAGKIDPLKYDLPEQTYILEENVPHEWLLTKLKAIIAHGGVGVTHAVLRAGIPMIPISIFAAQFYWGKKLFDLGLAAKPLKIRKLQVGDVYNSIIYLRNNEKLLNNLTEFKKLILEENGEQKAANWIFDFLSKK
jgi:UDP:flavonoid glycosyltransferase YjiC (YdhE family)